MAINYLTDGQVEELRQNPYVKNVSNKSIIFEDSFKELFLIDYQSGMKPTIRIFPV